MPQTNPVIIEGVTHGYTLTFTERPSADPFRVGRDLKEGDYLQLMVPQANPSLRHYRVERVLARGETHAPGVVLRDVYAERRGIMRQVALNRIRPLQIYRPSSGALGSLVMGAVYQDIETGYVVRAIPGAGGRISLEPLAGQDFGRWPMQLRVPFRFEAMAPRLVLRWAPQGAE